MPILFLINMMRGNMKKFKKYNLSVIISAYNEEKNIAETIRRVHKTVPDAEILVIDAGSKDNTSKVVESMKIPNLKVIRYTPSIVSGKGRAIRLGIENAKGDIQVQVDADSQFPPEEIPGLIQPILDGKADITFCSRFMEGATVQKGSLTGIRRFANWVVSTYTSILSGFKLTDVNAGFKAWTTKAMRDIELHCDHFGYEPEIAVMAGKRGYKIVEVPVNYKIRKAGNTGVFLLRDGIIIPWFLIKTKLFRK